MMYTLGANVDSMRCVPFRGNFISTSCQKYRSGCAD